MYPQRFLSVAKSRVAISSPRAIGARSITSTPRYEKGPVEATKETLEKANRVVGDAAAKGIDKGSEAASKVKHEWHDVVDESSSSADQKLNEAKGKANEVAGKAKGTASELEGEAKGKASEVAGKAKEAKEKHVG